MGSVCSLSFVYVECRTHLSWIKIFRLRYYSNNLYRDETVQEGKKKIFCHDRVPFCLFRLFLREVGESWIEKKVRKEKGMFRTEKGVGKDFIFRPRTNRVYIYNHI